MAHQHLSGIAVKTGVALATGFAVGRATEMVSVEAFAHQHLAHRNLELSPTLKKMSRLSLVMAGMSPNRFAAGHRIHHHEQTSPPQGILGSLRHMYRAGFGYNGSLEEARAKLEFPGLNAESDPLLKEQGGRLAYRDDPKLEKFVRRGNVYQFLPPLGAVVALGGINIVLRRKAPIARAAAGVAGYVVGLAARVGTTAYAEGRAGMDNGRFNTGRLGAALAPRIAQHQDHHDTPYDITAGSTGLHQTYYKALVGTGLMHQPQAQPAQDMASTSDCHDLHH